MKIIAQNKKARRDYLFFDAFEAGIMLTGTEVKSIRDGKINMNDSYAKIKNEEIFLINCHIAPYTHGNIYNHDPLRARKLLLKKQEIKKLIGKVTIRGFTIIPLKLYFKDGKVKVEISLAKGKKFYDKREDIKKREDEIKMARARKIRA
jgi:SsrA-binding protein